MKQALEQAKKENKLVFVDFSADWCAPCKAMMKFEFPKQDVGEYMNKTFVSIAIDGEKGEGPRLADQFSITGYPTMFVLRPDGTKVMEFNGYQDGREMIRQIQNKLDPEKTLPKYLERYKNGERDRGFISLLCEMLTKSENVKDYNQKLANAELAHNIAQDYFKSLPDSVKTKQENQFVLWQYTKYAEDPTVQYLKKNMDSFDELYKPGFQHVVDEAYKNTIIMYLTGGKPFRKDIYEKYKKEFEDMQLFKKVENSDVAFQFIDIYGKGDLDAYIDYCSKNFSRLTKNQLHKVLMNYTNLLRNATPAQKEHAIRMLRNALPDLDTQSMYYVTTEVKELMKN